MNILTKNEHKKLDFLFFSRLINSIADQLLLFLIPLIIYKITGSASMSGLSFALESLPRIISFFLAGIMGDKIGGSMLFMKTDFYSWDYVNQYYDADSHS